MKKATGGMAGALPCFRSWPADHRGHGRRLALFPVLVCEEPLECGIIKPVGNTTHDHQKTAWQEVKMMVTGCRRSAPYGEPAFVPALAQTAGGRHLTENRPSSRHWSPFLSATEYKMHRLQSNDPTRGASS